MKKVDNIIPNMNLKLFKTLDKIYFVLIIQKEKTV